MLVLHRFFETLRCLDDFLTSAGEGRLGRGARVIERIAEVLMYAAIALFILAFIIYGIDVAYLKMPVSAATKEWLWFALLFFTVFLASFDLWLIEGFVSLVLGLRRLADVLPGLINESMLLGDVPECVSEYFRGDAARALSRVYGYLLLSFFFRLFAIPATLTVAYMALFLAGYSAASLEAYAEFVDNVVTKTTINTALGILGIILTIIFSIGSLLIRGRAEPGGVPGFINGVRFFMFEWFAFAIFIIALSMAIPPVYAIFSSVPLTLAITIDLVAYLMLAITVIEHMQSPRGRPRRRPGRLRGPWS
jgi:hypothetical protein